MGDPLDFATPDDSVFCQLCEPPYETSIAMWATHLVSVHGYDPDELVEAVENAEVLDFTDPRGVGA